MKRVTIIMAAFISLLWVSAGAKTCYISKATGSSDSNTGQSWSAAWSTISKVNAATVSGDTVVFGTGIWRGTELLPPSGTAGDRTCFIDSLFYVATPTTYPTRRVSYIFGSDSLGGWTQVGSTSVWTVTKLIASNDASLYQGDEKILIRQASSGAVNSAGKWYYDAAATKFYVWCAASANPNMIGIEETHRQAINLNFGQAGIHDDGPDYVSFVGMGFKYGQGRIFGGGESSKNQIDYLTLAHCYVSCASGDGSSNPSLLYDDRTTDYPAQSTGWRITACSLGNVYAWYPVGTNTEDGSHGNAITVYSLYGGIIDSNVFFGHQSECGLYFKNGMDGTNGAASQDTVRFNRFDGRTGGALAIRIWGANHDITIYGNTIVSGGGDGILIGYGTVGASAFGGGVEGHHKIYNNTFYNCPIAIDQHDNEDRGFAGVQTHNEFKYNVIYNTTASSTTQFFDSLRFWDRIDSNMYYAASGTMTFYTPRSLYQSWANYVGGGTNLKTGLNTAADNHSSNTTNPAFANAAIGDFSRPNASGEMNQQYGGRQWTVYGASQTKSQSSSITVLSPNGGENWLAGSSQNITWSSQNVTGNVKLDYSTNSGSTWLAISASAGNTGSYAWTIPAIASTTCLVRVSQLAGGTAADQSNAGFSIGSTAPSITVTSPNGGENWAATSSHSILWNSQNLTGSVKLDYSINNGSTWVAVSASTGNTGSYSWVVPNSTSLTCLVRASQLTGGTASDQSNSDFAISDTSAPSGVGNLAAGTATSTSVPLTWTAPGDDGSVGTAGSYDLRYSSATITTANFSSATKVTGVLAPKTPGSAESFTVTGLASGTSYNFAVKAADEVPNWGPISNIVSRTTSASPVAVPTLANPANGATGVSTSPTLTWNASANATSYRLQVSTDPAFGATVIDQSSIVPTSLVVSGLASSTTYYWRVNASGGSGTSAYSPAWSLTTTAITPPAAPVQLSPGNGVVSVAISPTLSWSNVTGAISYRVQVSTSATFASTLVDRSGIGVTSLAVTGLSNSTMYYWRVNASNGAGASPYSAGWSFTTILLSAPLPPIPVSPVNGATRVSTSPTLTWNPSTNATSYRLQVSTSSSFGTKVVDQSGISGSAYSLTGLRSNRIFYWRVSAANAGGSSTYSATMSFKTGWKGIAAAGDSATVVASFAEMASPTESMTPSEFSLGQNYPNPFNPTTRIEFSLPEAGRVTLDVFNVLGEKVKTLVDGQMTGGSHTVEWNSKGENGNSVASGIYFYRLTTGDKIVTRKMILLK